LGDFGPCTATCNGGNSIRSVICYNAAGNVTADRFCPQPKPLTFQLCSTQPCANSHVKGDPDFNGFLGQKYQIHGMPDSVFNIITSPLVQYNALFVFIGDKTSYADQCDIKRTQAWTHEGTYLGTLALKTSQDKILLESGSCLEGIKSVTVNGQSLKLGESVTLASATIAGSTVEQSITYSEWDRVIVKLAEVELTLINSDNFFNQNAVMTKLGWKSKSMHGLLGQTWRRVSSGSKKDQVIQGTSFDYQEQADDLFGDDFVMNKF
jgi:hypothetical protein